MYDGISDRAANNAGRILNTGFMNANTGLDEERNRMVRQNMDTRRRVMVISRGFPLINRMSNIYHNNRIPSTIK